MFGVAGSNAGSNILHSINKMMQATLCFLMNENSQKILLGMKKRGLGVGKYNGFGGKLEDKETLEEAAVRELHEETGVKAAITDILKVAKLNFFFTDKKEWNQTVHVFFVKDWKGKPKETEEMKPKWFNFNQIPFEKMWQDDQHWLPLILKGKKLKADFTFKEDNETIKDFNIKEI